MRIPSSYRHLERLKILDCQSTKLCKNAANCIVTTSAFIAAAGELDGNVLQRNPAGSTRPDGKPLDENFVIIEIPLGSDDDQSTMVAVEKWLARNRIVLAGCEAHKTFEFYTFLEPDIGSRILTIPNSLIRIAAGLSLNIANQAIRIMAEDKSGRQNR